MSRALIVNLYTSLALISLLTAVPAHSGEAPRLSPAEMKVIYKAAGLTERGGRFLDACGQSVQPDIEVIDLNGDGQPEVFVMVGSSCYGMAGAKLSLLIKDKSGRWRSNFDFPAGGYKLLRTKNKGYPDIEIGGPGFCFPIWRWNGTQYDIHKRCDRKDRQHLNPRKSSKDKDAAMLERTHKSLDELLKQ